MHALRIGHHVSDLVFLEVEMHKKTITSKKLEHYELRTEIMDMGIRGFKSVTVESAYSFNGDYIGDTELAEWLVSKFGIVQFEKANPSHCVCSIGFNPNENKWYGWSHRAIMGFGVGSKAMELYPDRAISEYSIKTIDEAKEAAKLFAESVS